MIEHDKVFTMENHQLDHAKMIQTGMTALKQLDNVPQDAGLNWVHPTDGEIHTENDEALRNAINGGIAGAFREMKSEGLEDYAKTIVDFNRST